MVRKVSCAFLSVLIIISTVQLAPAYAQTKYKAKGQIDPAQVRTVVTNLGVGKNIKLKLNSGVAFTGEIMEIATSSVTIAQSKKAQPNVVAYDQIQELQEKKFPGWAKAYIITGVIIAVLIVFDLAMD